MFGRKHRILSPDADLLGGGGAGGSSETAPKDGGAPAPKEGEPGYVKPAAPAAAPAPKVAIPENWKDILDPEIFNDPSIKSIKDINALAKSFIHGQKLVGADKIVVPTNLTSDEEWGKVYQKLGMPEQLTDYKFDVPDGTDPEFTKKFSELAHKEGILPKQAAKLFTWYNQIAADSVASHQAGEETKFTQTVDGLKREWGTAYDRKLANASGLFNMFADQPTKDFMKSTGFGNHPLVLKMMSKVAESFGEGKFIAPGGNGSMGMTPGDAQAKIDAMYKNKDHPYFHKSHEKHSEARAEVATWHASIAASKRR